MRALGVGGLAVDKVITGALDVRAHERVEVATVRLGRRAQVELGHGVARHYVRRHGTDAAGCHPAHVQRWILQRLLIIRAHSLGTRDAYARTQCGLVVTDVCKRDTIRFRQTNAVVKPGDQHAALFVLHRREQRGEPQRWIRRVVAVVAAVQRRARAEHR